MTSLLPGNLIRDRYLIESLIGQGGMGAVYRVADQRLPGRLCALKAMRNPTLDFPALRESDAARQQFLAEASTLACLDHPNLPKVSDYFTLDDYDCLVMDYIPGQDLQQRIQDARRQDQYLPIFDVLDWVAQLCEVLAYLHAQEPPIIHGDIKPANIKLTTDGRLKLVDFGLVRPGDPQDPRTLTGTGLRGMGSLPYAALEQYAGSHITARTDIYSLGATCYHLVTNQAPASAHERFLDPGVLVSPRQLNPALPPPFERAILFALAPHPNDRPVSVAAWHKTLGELLDGQSAAADRETVALSGAESMTTVRAADSAGVAAWRANWWYALAAAILLVVALVLTLVR